MATLVIASSTTRDSALEQRFCIWTDKQNQEAMKIVRSFRGHVREGDMSEHLENQWVDLVRSARGLVDQSIRSGRKEMTKSAKKLQGQFETLDDIRSELGDCKRCKLHSDRNHIVFGVGNPKADLVIVGEAPGRDEDKQGEPFVGRAGKLLTDILSAIGLSRDDVYICNVIKCRPPQNRNPELDEIEQCEPFLKAQIASISPSIILTVGKFAAHALLQVETPISQLRGNFFEYEGIPMIPTYHPAYLLRNPSAKKIVWEDMKKLHAKLCTLTGKKLVLKGK